MSKQEKRFEVGEPQGRQEVLSGHSQKECVSQLLHEKISFPPTSYSGILTPPARSLGKIHLDNIDGDAVACCTQVGRILKSIVRLLVSIRPTMAMAHFSPDDLELAKSVRLCTCRLTSNDENWKNYGVPVPGLATEDQMLRLLQVTTMSRDTKEKLELVRCTICRNIISARPSYEHEAAITQT